MQTVSLRGQALVWAFASLHVCVCVFSVSAKDGDRVLEWKSLFVLNVRLCALMG